MEMLNDGTWRRNPYMNQYFHISSPTALIYDSYYVNSVFCIFKGYVNNNFSSVCVATPNPSELDEVTKAIFATLELAGIPLHFIKTHCSSKPIISKRALGLAVKRAIPNEFDDSHNGLNILYHWNVAPLQHKKRSIELLLSKIEILIRDGVSAEAAMQAIIAESIRQRKFDLAEEYLVKFASLTKDRFAYINKQAFLYLRRDGEQSAKTYLDDYLNVDDYMTRCGIDFSHSLVMKNYASLLSRDDQRKYLLMNECLRDTPQDVDLWISFYKTFPEEPGQVQHFLDMLNHGIIRQDILAAIPISSLSVEFTAKASLCAIRHGNHAMLLQLRPKLLNGALGELILKVCKAVGVEAC